jgi:hypothetical protein
VSTIACEYPVGRTTVIQVITDLLLNKDDEETVEHRKNVYDIRPAGLSG